MVMTALPPAISRRVPPGSLVRIDYVNESGEVSHRRVRVDQWVHGRNGHSYLKGYCFLRGEDRTFRADRILDWAFDEPAAPSRFLAEPAPEPWKPAWPTREVASAPAAAAAVPTTSPAFARVPAAPHFSPKPSTRARGGGRGRLGLLAAGAAFFIIRSLVMGGSQPAPAPVPRSVPTPPPAPRTDLASARSLAFRAVTSISDEALEAAYERADANRDGSLDWSEISTFQSCLESKYAYKSNELALRPAALLGLGPLGRQPRPLRERRGPRHLPGACPQGALARQVVVCRG